jgi:very-short-patch-repair endonuclease
MRRRKLKSRWKLLKRGRGIRAVMIGTLHSKSEKLFLDTLEAVFSVKIERQFMLDSRFFDGRFGEHLIEVDGFYWHSKPAAVRKDALKDHIAQKYGFKLHRIRLNKSSEVPMALEQYKTLLKEIFDARNTQLQISPAEGSN